MMPSLGTAPETVTLRAGDIIVDDEWNSRRPDGSAALIPSADRAGAELSDAQLIDDIRARGLINPPRVRAVAGGFQVVAGNRRVKACQAIDEDMEVLCTLQTEQHDHDADELRALADNIAENVHRRDLKPFELAAALFKIHTANPDVPIAELAEVVGLTAGYCYELLAVATKACPELWDIFRRYGYRMPGAIRWNDLLKVCRLPKHKQLEAWNKLVDEQLGRDNGQRKPKPKRASTRQLRRYLRQVAQIPGDAQYQAGLRYGLLVALGQQSWALTPEPAPEPQKGSTDDDTTES